MWIVLAVARVKGGDWRWRTQIVDPRAGHPPPGRRLEIEIGDWERTSEFMKKMRFELESKEQLKKEKTKKVSNSCKLAEGMIKS